MNEEYINAEIDFLFLIVRCDMKTNQVVIDKELKVNVILCQIEMKCVFSFS
jgi:hypothetical protein